MKLNIGDNAPDFTANGQDGKKHSLSDYKNQWLLLYFYPKDFTPGCTVEAEKFQDNFDELKKRAVIIGISADTIDSHKNFCDKYGLQFTLLSDTDKKIIDDYGANGLIFARRVSFLINPDGKIVKIYDKVSPEAHAAEILKDLNLLVK